MVTEFSNTYMQHHGRWGNMYLSMRLASVLLRTKSTSSLRIICKSNSTLLLSMSHQIYQHGVLHVTLWNTEKRVLEANVLNSSPIPPIRCRTIIWTSAGLLSFEPLGTNFNEILIKNSKFVIQEIVFENVICKMVAILSRERRSSLTSTEM